MSSTIKPQKVDLHIKCTENRAHKKAHVNIVKQFWQGVGKDIEMGKE